MVLAQEKAYSDVKFVRDCLWVSAGYRGSLPVACGDPGNK